MSKVDHQALARLKATGGDAEKIKEWNQYREDHPDWTPRLSSMEEPADLSDLHLGGANLNRADLSRANLFDTDLSGADLSKAILFDTDLSGADLGGADLRGARLLDVDLTEADLSGADLRRANLTEADLRIANLGGADLREANFTHAVFRETRFDDTDLSKAQFYNTILVDVDLSQARGLESLLHTGPSSIGLDTLVRSKGRIPEKFLRGCGFSEADIQSAKLHDPALTAWQISEIANNIAQLRMQPIAIGGVFISYSHANWNFVDKLYDRLDDEKIAVWLDRHDLLAGPLQDQIDRGLRINDVVLLVLSEESIKSDWVEHELEVARKKEQDEDRDVLCPVALDASWKGKMNDVLWRQLKKKEVLDFSEWETEAFNPQFAKLLKGLKIYYPPAAGMKTP